MGDANMRFADFTHTKTKKLCVNQALDVKILIAGSNPAPSTNIINLKQIKWKKLLLSTQLMGKKL